MSSHPTELTEALPQPLRQTVEIVWHDWIQSCHASGLSTELPLSLSRLGRLWACSEFIAQLCVRKPHIPHELCAQGLESPRSDADYRQLVRAAIASAETNDAALMHALRVLRQKEMLRIAWRDLDELASVEQVLYELSAFAEAVVSETCDYLYTAAVEKMGTPVGDDGGPQSLLILAMGKLGGCELNFSSDIDLIFAYANDGHTQNGRHLSNHEFFVRLAQQFIKVIGEITVDGFVFRVDTRLRPYGDSGPLVMSFSALEQYYQSQGRDWERYAMIKAKIITGDERDREALASMLKPFIYRRYLDYSAFESIREMKAMIEADVRRKGISDNIKLGRGGIREIEFIGQTFQMIRGGRDTALQSRSIIEVLHKLHELEYLSADETDKLKTSYLFLRKLENRLQIERDQQTHRLPSDEISRWRIALAMNTDSWEQLENQVMQQRDNVSAVFKTIVAANEDQRSEKNTALRSYWQNPENDAQFQAWLQSKQYAEPAGIIDVLASFRNSAGIRTLSEAATDQLLQLVELLLLEIAEYSNQARLLKHVLDVLHAIVGRRVYINLLLEYPQARSQMLSLCAASHWFSSQLSKTPILLDELLDRDALHRSYDREDLARELDYLISSVAEDDLEQHMDRLRQFHHAQVMKVAVLDVNQILGVAEVADSLSDVAEVILEQALKLAWSATVAQYGSPGCQIEDRRYLPSMAIIAYGKLGGRELGYGSDLDIVFLHDSSGQAQVTDGAKSIDNLTFFSRVAQRVLHILSTRTYSGMLYETDIRLRPDGKAGLMVSGLSAFESYQREKAWTWEHQSLIRARVVVGSDPLRQEFDRIRRSILAVERQSEALCRDVTEMRQKMRTHLGSRDASQFDIKQDEGGLVDIEFVAQAGVLLNAVNYPDLLESTSTRIVLQRLAACGWITQQELDDMLVAYDFYRQQVNRRALEIELAETADAEMQQYRERVTKIWKRFVASCTK